MESRPLDRELPSLLAYKLLNRALFCLVASAFYHFCPFVPLGSEDRVVAILSGRTAAHSSSGSATIGLFSNVGFLARIAKKGG